MALRIDRAPLDEFCPRLFRALDGLGLLPLYLGAKPNEFEKYPRLLFGSIQRYNDVEAGFKEWESRVLRDAPYRKEERYPELEMLRQWMMQEDHTALFTSKVNMQHLRTSLYARMFQYLYPRRVLVNAYCVKQQGNPDAIAAAFVASEFPSSVATDVQKLREACRDGWEIIVADARVSLLANAAYYDRVLRGKEKIAPEDVERPEMEDETDSPEEAQS